MIMTPYDSITNRVSAPSLPGVILKGTGNCPEQANPLSPGFSPPTSEVRSYEPSRVIRTLYDPSRGRKFNKLKRAGDILFSEYQNSLSTVNNYIHSRDKSIIRYRVLTYACLTSPPNCIIMPPEKRVASWTENDDFRSLSKRLPIIGTDRYRYDEEVEKAISSTQQSAFDQALNAYDLLTELGELRETAQYLTSKLKGGADLISKFASKDAPAWREGRRHNAKTLMRSSDAVLRSLGRRWMEYRYAIMPLLYSFKDIEKVLNEKAYRYQSDRSRQKIDLNSTVEHQGRESLIVRSSGEIVVRSLTKARYDLGDLQRLVSVIGLNPIRTAWELVPLSFVVDWFLNVGEAITALTGVDYSSQRLGTTSVRETSIFEYEHSEDWMYNYVHFSGGPWKNQCGQTVPSPEVHLNEIFTKVVRKVVTDSYVRTVWSRPSPKLIFDPFLNWKRSIDAIVLGYQPAKKILRSL